MKIISNKFALVNIKSLIKGKLVDVDVQALSRRKLRRTDVEPFGGDGRETKSCHSESKVHSKACIRTP